MARAFLAVVLIALACTLVRSARVGLAGDYIDPVGRIAAQDEALYANSSIAMARHDHWLTPAFMGRPALYKPPMLIWLSALASRIGGISRLALRFPVALMCALAAGLIFLWTAELDRWQAGACAVALLLSDHLWHVLSGMALTDGLLAAFWAAALYFLFSDPWLELAGALWGFAASVAAAILSKSVAGLLPLAILGLYWIAAPPKRRPRLARVALAAGLSLALAAPWFIYQAAVHYRWFWTEMARVEILGFGTGAPPQTSQESQVLFYVKRLLLLDPPLAAMAIVGLPPLFRELRARRVDAILLACWMAVALLSVFAWSYRNAAYLLPAIPALAIVAAVYSPIATSRTAMAILALVVVWKVLTPATPWGISFASGTVQPLAPLVSSYCARDRGNELILVGLDDDLYASALPLPKLRYCLVGAAPAREYGMPFRQMGIILTVPEYDDLPRWEPYFLQRLKAWGVKSTAPIGTLIMANSTQELAQLIRAHPRSDFLMPAGYRDAADAVHEVIEAGRRHILLLGRPRIPAPPRAWSCGM